jgi:hypothetical protein
MFIQTTNFELSLISTSCPIWYLHLIQFQHLQYLHQTEPKANPHLGTHAARARIWVSSLSRRVSLFRSRAPRNRGDGLAEDGGGGGGLHPSTPVTVGLLPSSSLYPSRRRLSLLSLSSVGAAGGEVAAGHGRLRDSIVHWTLKRRVGGAGGPAVVAVAAGSGCIFFLTMLVFFLTHCY